jgi:hypothetical protein
VRIHKAIDEQLIPFTSQSTFKNKQRELTLLQGISGEAKKKEQEIIDLITNF